ncbi:MarR family winged helix-turn-helix transcriptional regulator [Pseudonocardia acaciae]|uniref:MarR family winged helix-turn-helix transcriptional regulator n=1 Tax=Pseudonocardia acaciae TaxID=551276 RepID=UPI00048A751E|nr:MarR family transcriptional regulator [Pseudonocardia acaciae]
MPNWLDNGQQRDWRAFIEGSIRLIELLDRELRAGHSLTLAEYEILVRLSEAPGRRMRMAELAEVSYYSRSRLSHSVGRLEARELVCRDRIPDDKRGVVARLTERGMRALRLAAPDNLRIVREYFVDVIDPEDLRAVGRAFGAVSSRLSVTP